MTGRAGSSGYDAAIWTWPWRAAERVGLAHVALNLPFTPDWVAVVPTDVYGPEKPRALPSWAIARALTNRDSQVAYVWADDRDAQKAALAGGPGRAA